MPAQGFCYLTIVEDIGEQLGWDSTSVHVQQVAMADALGAYPSIPSFVRFLRFNFPDARNTCVYRMGHGWGYVLHYPCTSGRILPLGLFLSYYSSFKDFAVGSDRPFDLDTNKVARALGVDAPSMIQRGIQYAVPSDALTKIAETLITKEFDKVVGYQRNDKEVKIPFRPSPELIKVLETSFDHFKISFGYGPASHAYAAASRYLEMEDLLISARYNNSSPPGPMWDAQVVDVGGNWLTHFNRGRRYVHCDSPILSCNDARRASQRRSDLQSRSSMTDNQREILRQCVSTAGERSCSMFCVNKGGDCKIRAPTCIFVHSVYDMSNVEIADAMEAHQSNFGYGTFLFVPDILVNLTLGSSGYIPIFDAKWTIETDPQNRFARTGSRVINFCFAKDPSYSYTHDLATYISFVTCKVITSTNGTQYAVEMLHNINGAQYFKLTKLTVNSPTSDIMFHSWWTSTENKVCVNFFVLDSKLFKYGRRRLVRKSLTVSNRLLSDLFSYALRQSDVKFTTADIYSYAKAMQSRVIINGAAVVQKEGEFSNDIDFSLLDLVQFVYVKVYEKKYSLGLVIQEVMNDIKNIRAAGESGLVSRIISCLWDRIKKTVGDVSADIGDYFIGSLIERKFKYEYGVVNCQLRFANLVQVFGSEGNLGRAFQDVDENLDCISLYFTDRSLLGGGEVAIEVGAMACCEPNRSFVLARMPGDNHCQFHAVAKCLDLNLDGIGLRHHLAESRNIPGNLKSILKVGSSEWGNDDSLMYISQHYDVTICVHMVNGGGSFDPSEYEKFRRVGRGTRTIHLEYNGNHYNALLSPREVKLPEVDPVEVLVGGSPLVVQLDQVMDLMHVQELPSMIEGAKGFVTQTMVSVVRSRLTALISLMSNAVVTRVKELSSRKADTRQLFHALTNPTFEFKSGEWQFSHATVYMTSSYANSHIDQRDKQCAARYCELFNVESVPPSMTRQAVSEAVHFRGAIQIMRDLEQHHSAKNRIMAKKILNNTSVSRSFEPTPPAPRPATPSPSPPSITTPRVELTIPQPTQSCKSVHDSAVQRNKVRDVVDIDSFLNNDDQIDGSPVAVHGALRKEEVDKLPTYIMSTPDLDDDSASIDTRSTATSIVSRYDDIKRVREELAGLPDEFYESCIGMYKKTLPPNCLNRSQAKLRDVLIQCSLNTKSIKALDLCSGPGGFVIELARDCEEVYAVFYKKALRGSLMHPSIESLRNVLRLSVTDTNDITDSRFGEELSKVCPPVDLVTADGCLHIDNNLDPERDNYKLILAEVAIGYSMVKIGGSVIIKMFDLCAKNTRTLIRKYATFFRQLRLIKSSYSSQVGGEVYVCFIEKLMIADEARSAIARTIIRNFTSENNRQIHANLTQLLNNVKENMQKGSRLDRRTDQGCNSVNTVSEIRVSDWIAECQVSAVSKPETDIDSIFDCSRFTDEKVGLTICSEGLPGIGVVALPCNNNNHRVSRSQFHLVYWYRDLRSMINWFQSQFATNLSIHVLTSVSPEDFPSSSKHHYYLHKDKQLPLIRHSQILGNELEKSWSTGYAYQKLMNDRFDKFETGSSRVVYCRNAIRERMKLYQAAIDNIHSVYYTFYSSNITLSLTSVINVRGIELLCRSHHEDFGIIHRGQFVVKPSDLQRYEKGFDGKKFVDLQYKDDDNAHPTYASDSDYILVGRSSCLMQDEKLLESNLNNDVMTTYLPPVELKSGVPGCGKTKTIIDSFKEGDFIITSTRENRDDIARRVPEIGARTKTVHSVILNQKKLPRTVNTLYVDEALMSHAGELLMAVNILKPLKVVMSGDEQQIPYINRVPLMESCYGDAVKTCTSVTYQNRSYRVPRDVATLFSPTYANGFRTSSTVNYSLKYSIVTGPQDLPKGVQILVFRQGEKSLLKSYGHMVSTVHEYQGRQAEEIILYRDSKLVNEPLYKSKPHILVALTRHTHRFTYYTRIEDEITSLIKQAQTLTTHTLESHNSSLSGGGIDAHCDGTMVLNSHYDGPDYKDIVEMGYSIDLPRPKFVRSGVCPTVVRHTARPYNKINPGIPTLQSWYDSMLPGVSCSDQTHDNFLIQENDLSVIIAGQVKIDKTKLTTSQKRFDTMRPNLKTNMGLERIRCFRESMLAYIKRNDAVPVPIASVSSENVVSVMMERFIGYFDQSKLEKCLGNPISLNSESIYQWSLSQDKPVHTDLVLYPHEEDLSTFEFMIKPRPKPDLTTSSVNTYASLQTIASQKQKYNQFFCPLFKDLKERVLTCLHERFSIFSDVTIQEFANKMTRMFPRGFDLDTRIFEFDVSKYDKSQDEIALLFDAAVMRFFGVSEDIIQLWINIHRVTDNVDYKSGIKTRVVYQRKSGDPFTFTGNTLYLMACLAMVVDLNDITYAAFGGDDSVIFTRKPIGMRAIEIFEGFFNLEVKLFERQFAYFCSKFLIFNGSRWYFLPDLLKVVTKLGRHDLRNPTHVEDYRVSLSDLLSVYNDKTVIPVFNEAFNERYPSLLGDHSHIINILLELVKAKQNFDTLYYSLKTDKLCWDPTAPKFD